MGWPVRIAPLHFALSWASSGCTPAARRSSEMQFFHFLFGRPLLLLPVCSVWTLRHTQLSSCLSTWPNQRSLLSLIFPTNSPTFTLPLMTAFSMRSSLVFPRENLNIFISATSIFLSWPLVTATVSIPYSIAGGIIVLYILPFTAAGTFLSHMISVTFLHAPHPAWIPFCYLLFRPSVHLYRRSEVFEVLHSLELATFHVYLVFLATQA